MLLSEEIFDKDGDLILVFPSTETNGSSFASRSVGYGKPTSGLVSFGSLKSSNSTPSVLGGTPEGSPTPMSRPTLFGTPAREIQPTSLLNFGNIGHPSIFVPTTSAPSVLGSTAQGGTQPILAPLGSSVLGTQAATHVFGRPSLGGTDTSSAGSRSSTTEGGPSNGSVSAGKACFTFTASVPPAADAKPDIRMLVSSKHMMLASPVFKAMLNGNFKEGRALKTDGHIDVTLPDDDAAAFRIILHIVHGRNRLVPRVINLDCLLKIAVLVDKYQMVEVVEAYSEGWIKTLKPTLFGNLSSDIGRWVCISWVFGLAPEFEILTRIVVEQLDGKIPEGFMDYLPVPEAVYHDIASRRWKGIAGLYDIVSRQIALYTGPQLQCPRDDGRAKTCDALMLGTILRSTLRTHPNMWPASPPPYARISFEKLSAAIEGMELENICQDVVAPSSCCAVNGIVIKTYHGVRTKFRNKTLEVRDMHVRGLALSSYKRDVKSEDQTPLQNA